VTKNASAAEPTISLIEELCLLAIGDDGAVAPVTSDLEFGMGIIGSCLVELCLRGRLDAELRETTEGEPPQAVVWVTDSNPVGEPALDRVLLAISRGPVQSVETWAKELLPIAPELLRMALARLETRGVIAAKDERIFWVLKSRRYPVIEGRELREAKLRIVDVLIGGSFPSPHDSVLIGLALISHVLSHIFSDEELRRLEPRINEVSSLDIVARAVEVAISDEIQRRVQAFPLSV
jgi:Golgi phosphoprotein 3